MSHKVQFVALVLLAVFAAGMAPLFAACVQASGGQCDHCTKTQAPRVSEPAQTAPCCELRSNKPAPAPAAQVPSPSAQVAPARPIVAIVAAVVAQPIAVEQASALVDVSPQAVLCTFLI